ncbi:unnamed protein product [Durusdinium trenchii]|uniref:Uncharacterized protein n=1 Tax=Durusdinium trenchii TaxID=1381693 RepID=A0ABP0IH19_9DINO
MEGSKLANAVFWKRSKWRLDDWECMECRLGCLQVTFVPALATEQAPLTVVNIGAACEEEFAQCLGSAQAMLASASVVCATTGMDISDGAKQLFKAQGCEQLRSVHKEVLGKELPWTEVVDKEQLRCSDGVWISEPLMALAALDGHGAPPRDGTGEICRQTLPLDHLLSLVVLQNRHAQDALMANLSMC